MVGALILLAATMIDRGVGITVIVEHWLAVLQLKRCSPPGNEQYQLPVQQF